MCNKYLVVVSRKDADNDDELMVDRLVECADMGAVEVVLGHQSASFASEQREKRGLK